eukprot:scaffold1307_cov106-Skeletonema_dohrnii-CCMP3373.AAC.3
MILLDPCFMSGSACWKAKEADGLHATATTLDAGTIRMPIPERDISTTYIYDSGLHTDQTLTK